MERTEIIVEERFYDNFEKSLKIEFPIKESLLIQTYTSNWIIEGHGERKILCNFRLGQKKLYYAHGHYKK